MSRQIHFKFDQYPSRPGSSKGARRRRGGWPIQMPKDDEGRLIPLDSLVSYDEDHDTLTICLPLTPTQNTHATWHGSRRTGGRVIHYSRGRGFRQACLTIAAQQVRHALGPFDPPWARRARITAVRCGPRPCDPSNVTAGLKEAIDVLLVSKPDRPGVGLITDDSESYLIWEEPENRAGKRGWGGLPGPSTWFFINRLRGRASGLL